MKPGVAKLVLLIALLVTSGIACAAIIDNHAHPCYGVDSTCDEGEAYAAALAWAQAAYPYLSESSRQNSSPCAKGPVVGYGAGSGKMHYWAAACKVDGGYYGLNNILHGDQAWFPIAKKCTSRPDQGSSAPPGSKECYKGCEYNTGSDGLSTPSGSLCIALDVNEDKNNECDAP